jgi:hypothetical protein
VISRTRRTWSPGRVDELAVGEIDQRLLGLREHLIAAGIEAGEIEDDSPGPSEEMGIVDPDGYVLMVAQIESRPISLMTAASRSACGP